LEKQDEIIEAFQEKIITLQKDVAELNADAIKLSELESKISTESLALVPTVPSCSPSFFFFFLFKDYATSSTTSNWTARYNFRISSTFNYK
jgi:hypothetical protein